MFISSAWSLPHERLKLPTLEQTLMPKKLIHKLAVVTCVAALPALSVAACGGVPGNAVATVDGEAIEKKTFDHWMQVAAKSGGQPAEAMPQPPEFTACIDNKKKTLPEPAKGQPKVTDEQLKTQCEQEYEALRDQVLQLLISFEWIEGEAEQLDIEVTEEEVRKQFEEQKKASFPKEEDYKKFLADSGQTEEDIMLRVRLDVLSNKIREEITKGKDQVTDAEIEKYYNENKERFAQPERRDLSVVLTKTKAKADAARRELNNGGSFKSVAKEYSIDEASKAQGGKLLAVAKGQQEKALDDAVFSADRGELTGPVKTQFGYYVFKVDKVTDASQQTLEQSKTTIKQLLASQKQQKALDEFVKDFREEWKEKTECREGFITQDCKNAPEEEEEAPGQPGAPQPGGPQQQPGAPQQQPGTQQEAPAPPTEE
jgi:foldase protein PrsA